MKKQFDNLLQKSPVIAILRGITNKEVTSVCDILYNSGIRILEIPLNSPDAIKSIAIAAEYCKGKMLVGAGTVLTIEAVNQVAAAGGSFIISPNVDIEVIKETKRLNLLSIPGFFTATEGFAAIKAGADYLKLFPACLGVSYIKDLQAVIKTPIFAVGGVNSENLADFLHVCCGVGIGSWLYKSGKSLEEVKKSAQAISEITKAL